MERLRYWPATMDQAKRYSMSVDILTPRGFELAVLAA